MYIQNVVVVSTKYIYIYVKKLEFECAPFNVSILVVVGADQVRLIQLFFVFFFFFFFSVLSLSYFILFFLANRYLIRRAKSSMYYTNSNRQARSEGQNYPHSMARAKSPIHCGIPSGRHMQKGKNVILLCRTVCYCTNTGKRRGENKK